MDKKGLNNESLEKVAGGFTTFTETDKDGNTIITKFGVINLCSGCGECELPVRPVLSLSVLMVQR